jgi:hypothetical protein
MLVDIVAELDEYFAENRKVRVLDIVVMGMEHVVSTLMLSRLLRLLIIL